MRTIDKAYLPLLLILTNQIQGEKNFWKKKWDPYFSVMGFSEFSAICGYTANQFKEIYEALTRATQRYYDSYEPEKGTLYGTLCAGFTLNGGNLGVKICFPYDKFDPCKNIPYVDILDGLYFPKGYPKKLEFRTCEDVMKDLIINFYENGAWSKRKSEIPRYSFFEQYDLKAALDTIANF